MSIRRILETVLRVLLGIAVAAGGFLAVLIGLTAVGFAINLSFDVIRRLFWLGLPIGFAWALLTSASSRPAQDSIARRQRFCAGCLTASRWPTSVPDLRMCGEDDAVL